jgi:hypothetical protein
LVLAVQQVHQMETVVQVAIQQLFLLRQLLLQVPVAVAEVITDLALLEMLVPEVLVVGRLNGTTTERTVAVRL